MAALPRKADSSLYRGINDRVHPPLVQWVGGFDVVNIGVCLLALCPQTEGTARLCWADTFFVVVQGGMGALAVMQAQSAAVMALHMGFSLIAFASSLMLALGTKRRHESRAVEEAYGQGVSRGFRNLTWFTALYSYIVVYIGAYVSHTDSQGGCSGWPLCNGEWIPELSGGVGIVFVHRVAAALLFVLIALLGHLAYWKHRAWPELRALGVVAVVLCLLQVLSGAAVVHTLYNEQLYIFAALAHILLIAGLFGVLCYMSVRVGQLSRKNKSN